MIKSVLAGVAVSTLALAAAQAHAATEVELKNVAARVIVTPEDRSDVKLTVAYGKAQLPKILIATRGDRLIANGQLGKSVHCAGGNARINGKGTFAQNDLPVIHIRVPRDAKVAAGGAVYGRIGATRSLEFALGGCGDWSVDDVEKKAELSIGGSGTVRARNVGEAEIAVGGSGDVYAGRVGKLEGAIGGSGSINVNEINGPVEIAIGGSGDVKIDKGISPKVEVSIAGSGNVRFNGEARDVELSVVGAGDVTIRKVTGRVSKSVMGSGNVHIGN
ncbi:DUF2807 domain-containing protein [Asticcacaulis sp. BYS171W]|uniref:DUF2807 domain-containing protein n=1 Tax=Asticcacaulis aquaticus TaxID=2984212 RepID=A0ABT5HPI0_9CAUL|nr:DUF2807 domain-containing protein [Asticcacaulis aquaticus]MDC7681973.1 DUF2807 domain-containing protein [Asticcacaulis aquaticus]